MGASLPAKVKLSGSSGWSTSCGLHFHDDAEVAETLQETLGDLLFVAVGKKVRTKVVILDAVSQHDVGRGEHRAGNGEDRLLGPAATLDTEELRPEVAVRFARRRPGGGRQRGLQPGGAPPRARGATLAGTFVESRA